MKKSRLLGALCVVVITVLAGPSYASVTYAYAGNNFDDFTTPSSYTSTMSLTGTVELDTALIPNIYQAVTPISFSFSDGINTLTDVNAKNRVFTFTTDAASNIIEWQVLLNEGFTHPVSIGDEYVLLVSINTLQHVYDTGAMRTCTFVDPVSQLCDGGPVDQALKFEQPGVWSMTAVPIPAALWLFSSGLLGLIGIARDKKGF